LVPTGTTPAMSYDQTKEYFIKEIIDGEINLNSFNLLFKFIEREYNRGSDNLFEENNDLYFIDPVDS